MGEIEKIIFLSLCIPRDENVLKIDEKKKRNARRLSGKAIIFVRELRGEINGGKIICEDEQKDKAAQSEHLLVDSFSRRFSWGLMEKKQYFSQYNRHRRYVTLSCIMHEQRPASRRLPIEI